MKLKRVAGAMLLACVLAGSPARAADDGAKPHTGASAAAAEKRDPKRTLWDEVQKVVVVIGGIVTLLGAAATTLPKSVEAFTLRARRKKELEHIQSLADLMAKIRKENLLSADTQADLGAQVDAEINEALAGLQKIRHRRQQAQQVRDKHEQPDLTIVQRVLLWYRPHSLLAWVPHVLAWAFIVVPLLGLAFELYDFGMSPHWVPAPEGMEGTPAGQLVDIGTTWGDIGTTLFGIVVWQLVFRSWALWWRSRWRARRSAAMVAAAA